MNKVGSLLKENRESKGYSVNEVVSATKIPKVYIEAIEKGDFSFFKNQDYYQQVFVGSYADFLGFDKNETLISLQDDAKNFEQTPKSDVKKVDPKSIEITKPAPLRSEFLTDYEVKSQPVDTNVIEENLNNEILDSQHIEQTTDEINQLIDEINQHVEVDLGEYFEQPEDAGFIHSSIVDDIAKINDEVAENKIPSIQAIPQSFNMPTDQFEQTDVIDLTSGIEIETVPNNVVEEAAIPIEKLETIESIQPTAEEDKQMNMMQSIFDVPKTSNDEQVIAALENTLKTQLDLNIIEEDPDKTSMDLKVAKALGDSKIVIDKKDESKIKRDKLVDRILLIVIILLVIALVYFAYIGGFFNFIK